MSYIRVATTKNMDASTMERRNVRSVMCSREDTSVVGYTRGRTVLRPAVPANPSATIPAPSHHKSRVGLEKCLAELTRAMNKDTNDCIAEGKGYNFPVFTAVIDPAVRFGKPITLVVDEEEEEDEGEENNDIKESPENLLEESDSKTIVTTKMFGKISDVLKHCFRRCPDIAGYHRTLRFIRNPNAIV